MSMLDMTTEALNERLSPVCRRSERAVLTLWGIGPTPDPMPMRLYGAYIRSGAWDIVRFERMRIDAYRCQICGDGTDLQVHHMTYERLGAERMDDLVTLCGFCHELVHRLAADALTNLRRERKWNNSEVWEHATQEWMTR